MENKPPERFFCFCDLTLTRWASYKNLT